MRRELAIERVRRHVFESVAREELLAHTLQCLVDLIEREAPRLSAAIIIDQDAGQPAARGVAGRLGEQMLSAAERLWDDGAWPQDRHIDAESFQASPIDDDPRWLSAVDLLHPMPAAAWVAPLMPQDPAISPLGALLITSPDIAPLNHVEQALIALLVELATFAAEHRRRMLLSAYRSMHDGLTNLPNATLLQDRLANLTELSRRNRGTMAVLLIDLVGLHAVNETLGRAAGDDVLRQLATRLSESMRRSDTIGRTGGAKLTLAAQIKSGKRDAATVARKVLSLLGAPVTVGGREVSVGANVGISLFPEDGDNPAHLLHAAEIALHRAKKHGRNTLQLFDPAQDDNTMADLELEVQLRRALGASIARQRGETPTAEDREAGLLELHYQPQVTPEGRIVGVEGLSRWTHPQLGRIPPDRFIRIAEESGLILSFGDWALKEAVGQACRWRDQFGSAAPRVAVNVSALQFAASNFIANLELLLTASTISPQLLELEITETILMADANEASSKITHLRSLGLAVAIDDFGTGYSSLAYLHRLTTDTLKIDRSFVSGLTSGDRRPPGAAAASNRPPPGGAAVIRAIISMGRSLGMTLVAEGVENEAQRSLLSRLGCEIMQGYLFSPPAHAAEVTEMLAAGGILPARQPIARTA